jgi:hypothetical protein
MTRKQADAAFDSLRRHASATSPPTGPADALKLLDRAVLTKLQRDAIVHYISVGPDNLALAYSIVKAGAATFAAAPFAGLERWAGPASGESDDQDERSTDRDLFAARLIALDAELELAKPIERATRLVDAFTAHVSAARGRFAGASPDGVGAAGEIESAVGELLEAAGIAYLIGQLLESPPRPVATATT